jgi:beta-lactamase regulating signal transducer with metallopeptidase domain
MTTEFLVLMFLKAQVAASCAILLVVALRLPVRRLFGAELGYSLWLLVPVAGLASLFPSLPEVREGLQRPPTGLANALALVRAPALAHASLVALVWAAGVLILGGLFVLGQWRFDRAARAGRAGPAATGFWPRMIVPAEYAVRFSLEERALIRAHERTHMDRRDPTSNLLIAFLQAISWFNPLAHLAAKLARMDQELSVDAKVMALHPKGRRRYAETLLKAHARGLNSPLACALALGGRHPLEVRLAMLGMRKISVRRDGFGVVLIGSLAMSIVIALWVLAPAVIAYSPL